MSHDHAKKTTAGGNNELEIPLPEEPSERDFQHHMEDLPVTDAAPMEPIDSNIWTVENGPFQVLGYDHGGYFYLPKGTRQVIELTAAAHNRQNLLALAKHQWWEAHFPQKKEGVAWHLAANAMLRACEKRGVYDAGRVRGRGAWEDNNRSVLHIGDRLLVDGQTTEIGCIESQYVYERAASLEVGMDASPLSTPEANRFAQLCDLPSWESGIFGRLLAGWCVVAPICGALQWRPHIWITGKAGSGKTWAADNLVKPAVGPIGLYVQGATTEAGIRQYLKYDARPVMFDEAEGETQKSAGKIQAVLELMRQASSETGAAIIKGSSSGHAQTYQIRITACLASVLPGATLAADIGRITVLTLNKNCSPDATEQFEYLRRSTHELLTDSYTASLRMRTVLLIPTIKKNVKTFARAVSGHVGNARAGDQLGTLLAGAYSLFSTSEISPEQALAWIKKQDWGELAPSTSDAQADESRCLAAILETVIRVDAGRGASELSIGEAVGAVSGRSGDYDGLDTARLAQALGRTGIKVRSGSDDLLISNNHREVGRILQATAWSKNWDVLLLRLPGAERAGAVYFSGSTSRAVSVPLSTVFPALED